MIDCPALLADPTILLNTPLDRATAWQLATQTDPTPLWKAADQLRHHLHGKRFHPCSIINARSGDCGEDCRFCAQSSHHRAKIEHYRLLDQRRALDIAADNDNHGVERLSLVTSGRSVDTDTLRELCFLYGQIRSRTGLKLCGSLGFLTPEKAEILSTAGVSRYHCNLETSRAYFSRICTTHSWEDKVATLNTARRAGMSLCSGGIIGMGETMKERIDLAFELRELGILSIPINIHTPIEGTPLAGQPPLPVEEVLTTIAIFRLINPMAVIRIAGGRRLLDNDQYRCFQAGANGAIVGNYLTTAGTNLQRDLAALSALGFTFSRRHH